MAGWTNLLWVLDVGGPPGARQRQPRPDVTPAEEAELVEIVESISFVVP